LKIGASFASSDEAGRQVVKLQNWIVALLREQFTTATVKISCPESADLMFQTIPGDPINADPWRSTSNRFSGWPVYQ
jgi:hypothetical protein